MIFTNDHEISILYSLFLLNRKNDISPNILNIIVGDPNWDQ